MRTWLWRITLASLLLTGLVPAIHFAIHGQSLMPLAATLFLAILILLFELPSHGLIGLTQYFAVRWIFALLLLCCAGGAFYFAFAEFFDPTTLSRPRKLLLQWIRLLPGGHIVVACLFMFAGVTLLVLLVRILKARRLG
jgi:hypothetical protein